MLHSREGSECITYFHGAVPLFNVKRGGFRAVQVSTATILFILRDIAIYASKVGRE
jgi:hypothetical protein